MIKTLFKIGVILVLFLTLAKATFAFEKEAGASAHMVDQKLEAQALVSQEQVKKTVAIRRMLKEWDSPLVDNVDDFIKACTRYNLNCYLLPAITGLESSFGHHVSPGSYNPFGWGGGYITFKDWSEAIDTVAQGLRTNYIDRGAATVEQIGPMYAESPTWAYRVNGFIAQFEQEEAKSGLLSQDLTIQL